MFRFALKLMAVLMISLAVLGSAGTALARTKEYAGTIKAEVPGGGPWKSKARMGYFFAIVTDLIGAKAGEG